jgi:hypothetical protein
MQTASAPAPVHALGLAVLPRTPRGKHVGSDPRWATPGRHPLRQALRAMSPCARARATTVDTPPLPHRDALLRRARAGTVDGPALPAGGLEDREALQPPSLGGLVLDARIAPARSGRRCQRRRRAGAPGPPCPLGLDVCKPRGRPETPPGLAMESPPVGREESNCLDCQGGLACF